MARMTRPSLALSLLMALPVLLLPATARAAEGPAVVPPQLAGVGFDQRLNQQIPLDLTFMDETGQPVQLREYFGTKPVILVLAYYECPRLCTLVLNGLVQGMLEIPFTPGKEFNVVTVSFDPREDWHLAASKKESYLTRLGKPGAEMGWHFLTGQEDQIKKLTDAVGFHYKFDPVQNQFIHASGIMILTPEGKISRYFYDVNYPGRDLRLGLVEASKHKIGSPVDQVLLYCFHYDATVGKYTASVMNFIRMGGVLSMVAVVGFVVLLRRQRSAVLAAAAVKEAGPQVESGALSQAPEGDVVVRGSPDPAQESGRPAVGDVARSGDRPQPTGDSSS
jgi:protein SCO1/2